MQIEKDGIVYEVVEVKPSNEALMAEKEKLEDAIANTPTDEELLAEAKEKYELENTCINIARLAEIEEELKSI